MAQPTFQLTNATSEDGILCQLVFFEIPGGITTPAEFALAVKAIEPQLQGEHPILVNGQGPRWAFAMITDAGHASPAVAVFEPSLGSYVVCTSPKCFQVRFTMGELLNLVDESRDLIDQMTPD